MLIELVPHIVCWTLMHAMGYSLTVHEVIQLAMPAHEHVWRC